MQSFTPFLKIALVPFFICATALIITMFTFYFCKQRSKWNRAWISLVFVFLIPTVRIAFATITNTVGKDAHIPHTDGEHRAPNTSTIGLLGGFPDNETVSTIAAYLLHFDYLSLHCSVPGGRNFNQSDFNHSCRHPATLAFPPPNHAK